MELCRAERVHEEGLYEKKDEEVRGLWEDGVLWKGVPETVSFDV